MQKAKRLSAFLLAVLMAAGLMSGCGEQKELTQTLDLRAAVCSQITSLDPAKSTQRAEQSVFYMLYENLMRFADDGTGRAVLREGMAREYKTETNYDGTVTYTFKLRSSANWSDGTRVKARDFVYAWQRLVDPRTDSPNHALLSMVKGYDVARKTGNAKALAVKAENDSTFTVTLAAPCAYFLSGVCTAVATMPLREDALQADAEGWATSPNLLSNGAYQIGVWTPEEYLQLRRSPTYYESKLVGVDTLRIVFAPDAEEAYRLYEEGKVDYVASPPRRALEDDTGQTAPSAAALPLCSTYCVLYNHISDYFNDADVRRAFDLSIDRAAIAAAMGAGAVPATGLVSAGVASGTDAPEDFRTVGGVLCAIDEEEYEKRCVSAVGSLKRAGYSTGREFPAIELLYVEDERTHDAVWELQRMWSEQLSVSMLPRALPREEFDSRIAAGDYEIAADWIVPPYNDAMGFLDRFSAMGPLDQIFYSSETYDVLLGVARASENLAARAAFLHDAETLLLEDGALSPLCFDSVTYLLRDGLHGVYHDGLGRVYFNGLSATENAAP